MPGTALALLSSENRYQTLITGEANEHHDFLKIRRSRNRVGNEQPDHRRGRLSVRSSVTPPYVGDLLRPPACGTSMVHLKVVGPCFRGRSSRRRGSGTTPRSRALADKTAKEPGEVRLIGKTATRGNLCQGRGGCQHQSFRPFDSPSHYVCVR